MISFLRSSKPITFLFITDLDKKKNKKKKKKKNDHQNAKINRLFTSLFGVRLPFCSKCIENNWFGYKCILSVSKVVLFFIYLFIYFIYSFIYLFFFFFFCYFIFFN